MQTAVATRPTTSKPFARELVRQLRALDSYGTYDGWTDERVLEPLILTKQRKAEIPVVGDPDEVTISRVQAFYNAVAVQVEESTGKLTVPLIHLSHEGFGRALISVGKLIVVDRTLRDVHRFGFSNLEVLEAEGGKIVERALDVMARYPEVTTA